ncbi:MAG: hypothetical protein JWM36_1865 [Hyphomicrobiales bacterium]|nr:hypothetical protein [Hyphomicrobiales bacterium]
MLRFAFAFIMLMPLQALAQSPHAHHDGMPMSTAEASRPTQPGQAAFAAIQEIVEILERDPATDWSRVDIEALRQHLIDMNNVTLSAKVKSEPVEGGMRYIVSGEGAVRDSIRRMTIAHAATMNGAGGWTFKASETADGAALTVEVPQADAGELRALGFIGVLTRGMRHQEHHLMIARGADPHH